MGLASQRHEKAFTCEISSDVEMNNNVPLAMKNVKI